MKRMIFIIEDDEDIARNLRELLESENYNTEVFTNGKEALDRMQSGEKPSPCVILLDLMMPIMDGFEFRKRQLADSRISSLPTIVMTADGNIEPKSLELKAAGFLPKPIDINELLQTIELYCGN